MSRLTVIEPGPGRIHFCYGQDLEYFRQLTSEHLVAYVSGGQTYKRFELTGKSRNEALDCFVYAYAALGLLGRVDWASLERRIKAAEGKKPDTPPESPMPPMPNKPQWPPMPPAPVRQRPRITFGRW
jgi:phage terminase large subunit GpA-like protein